MIFIQFLSDVRGGKVGQFTDQVNGNLPCFGGTLVFQCAAKDGFIDGIELTDLGNNQIGGG